MVVEKHPNKSILKIYPVVIAIKLELGKNKSSCSWIFREVIDCMYHWCLTSREQYFGYIYLEIVIHSCHGQSYKTTANSFTSKTHVIPFIQHSRYTI